MNFMIPKNINKVIFVLLFCLFSLLLVGCKTKINYFISSLLDPISAHELKVDESTSLLYYTFKTGNKESRFTLFFFPASKCTSLKYYLKPYLAGLNGDVQVYALQKRNVSHLQMGIAPCDANFQANNYFTQWIKDQKLFIEMITAKSEIKEKPIVLFGVSEMANVAIVLAESVPSVTHLAILGSGGMKQIDELKLIMRKRNPNININIIDEVFKKIASDPDTIEKLVFGQTYKYWNSVAYIDPLKYLCKLNIPILIAMGGQDEDAPVESAYYARDHFNKINKNNLSLLIYDNSDHFLEDNKGNSHRNEFLNSLYNWVLNTNHSKGSTQN